MNTPHEIGQPVEKWQYEIPRREWRRIRWAVTLANQWFMWPILASLLVPGLLAFVYPEWPAVGRAISWATSAATLGIIGWALFWYWSRPVFSVEVRGAAVRFLHSAYYVPVGLLRALIDVVQWNYENSELDKQIDWSKVWTGLVVDVYPDPPSAPQRPLTDDQRRQFELPEDEEPREILDPSSDTVVGLYYPSSNYAQIYGRYLLRLDVGGYELSHAVDQYLWPGQPEGDDLRTGRELGIRPLQVPSV